MLRRLALHPSKPATRLLPKAGGSMRHVESARVSFALAAPHPSLLSSTAPLRPAAVGNHLHRRPLSIFTPEPGAREALLKAAFEANRPTQKVGGVEGAYDPSESMAAFIDSQATSRSRGEGEPLLKDEMALPDGAGEEVEGAYPAHHSLEAFIRAQMRPSEELAEEEAADDTAFPEGAGEPVEGEANPTHHSLEAYIKAKVDGWEGAETDEAEMGREQTFADGISLVEELEDAGLLTSEEAAELVGLCANMDPGMLVILLASRDVTNSGRAAARMKQLLKVQSSQ
mmetsp:Transcript_16543/g.39997  ORF Transcript_16543/g.39997 Transcript_16543/m.39997 type:complete len:285 (+) Transcript_16543:34-888(+)